MSAKRSAGLLMYRPTIDAIEVFLVHPGGPHWATKNEGVWTLPKCEYAGDETALSAAQRGFLAETGYPVREPFLELGSVRQRSGKVVTAWAFQGDGDPAEMVSNTCEIEWPPRSGKRLVSQRWTEVDGFASSKP
jgi:predicted NUDIX family NTP pyrophosphohydrolase